MRLPPQDKLTHLAAGICVSLVLLPFGWQWAVGGCCAAAVLREVYGRVKRGRRMNPADWREAAADIGATLAGGAAVLASAIIGIERLTC
jgi:hypothetical protein